MPTVRFGNHAALDNGKSMDGEWVTIHIASAADTLAEQMQTITHANGVWVRNSTEPPAWVECDDPELEAALAAHYGCSIGEPVETTAGDENENEVPA